MQITIKQMSDNIPGILQRYILQEVEESPVLPICVTVDGVCNHADTDQEYVSLSHEPSETELADVCVKCGSIYSKYSMEWLR